MQTFEVLHVTNVSTGAAHVVGTVQATDYDDAHERAALAGLAPVFQTYRVQKAAEPKCGHGLPISGPNGEFVQCDACDEGNAEADRWR